MSRLSQSEAMTKRWQNPEYRARQSSARSAFAKTRQGTAAPGYKDGRTPRPEYHAFHQAKQRCVNRKHPYYPKYGGRGIEFRLTSFEQFIEIMGPRPSSKHSLDRIDVNGHYVAGNIRWALADVQVKNRRKFSCLEGFTDAELITEVQRRNLDVPKKQPRFVIDAA